MESYLLFYNDIILKWLWGISIGYYISSFEYGRYHKWLNKLLLCKNVVPENTEADN